MDIQSWSAIGFLVLLGVFLFFERKRVTLQKILFPLLYVVMYRTTLGVKQMDAWAKRFPRAVAWFGTISIGIGFLGMAVICVMLIHSLYALLTGPAQPGVSLVLPFKAKGTFYVPFFYWITTIFLIAVVHEFCHGMLARRHGIPIKYSGFAFLAALVPVLPAAFVEPDERNMARKSAQAQLAVFAAGPVSNIVMAALAILFTIAVLNPLSTAMYNDIGVQVTALANRTDGSKFPAELAGVTVGERILQIDGHDAQTVTQFTTILAERKPTDQVLVTTNRSSYSLTLAENPDTPGKPYLGVFVAQQTERDPSLFARIGAAPFAIFDWIAGFTFWLYALSLGIGLFNLLPLGPIDGGRMLKTGLESLLHQKHAHALWKWTSLFFLALIFVNLAAGFFA